jgi:hypothetical protein
MSSRKDGSTGRFGVSAHRLDEYFVLMKFSIFVSEGIWEEGKFASQYLV